MIIAIDGPAASGKGTLAQAARRASRPAASRHGPALPGRGAERFSMRGLPLGDVAAAARAAEVLDVARLDDPRLTRREIGDAASVVSAHQPGARRSARPAAPVRRAARRRRARRARHRHGHLSGSRRRSCSSRRRRRCARAGDTASLLSRDELAEFEAILADIRRRDERDMTRSAAPLRPAEDAVILDTTALDADGAFGAALEIIARVRKTARIQVP